MFDITTLMVGVYLGEDPLKNVERKYSRIGSAKINLKKNNTLIMTIELHTRLHVQDSQTEANRNVT